MGLKRFKFKNIKLSRKYALVVIVIILMYAIGIGYVSLNLYHIYNDVVDLNTKDANAEEINGIIKAIMEEESFASSYMVFKNNKVIEAYQLKVVSFQDQIKELVDQQFKYSQQLLAIESDHAKQSALFFDTIVPAVERNVKSAITIGKEDYDKVKDVNISSLEAVKELIDGDKQTILQTIQQKISKTIISSIILLLISIILGAASNLTISQIIKMRLNRLIEHNNTIASGNLKQTNVGVDGLDEIGVLANSVKVMSNTLRKLLQKMTTTSTELKDQNGTLSETVAITNKENDIVLNYLKDLAEGSQEQAQYASNISSAIKNLSQEIVSTNDESRVLNKECSELFHKADAGTLSMKVAQKDLLEVHEVIKTSTQSVRALENSSSKIYDLSNNIEEIARQTNLLALNAAIEAARAGEAGQGFAVVSKEIKKLSEQVENAVKEINQITQHIKRDTYEVITSLNIGYESINQSVHAINEASESFSEITERSKAISQIARNMDERLDVIEENGKNIDNSTAQIDDIAASTAGTLQTVYELASHQEKRMNSIVLKSDEMNKLSEDLDEIVNTFVL